MNKEFIIGLDEIYHEYLSLLGSIVKRYDVQCPTPSERVLSEIARLNIRGILDDRIFNLFKQLHDDWEHQLVEILTAGNLNDEEISEVTRSVQYSQMKQIIYALIRHVYQDGRDPNFTIWEIEVSSDQSYLIITPCGDYRIEQWHHEHRVAKAEIKDILTYDLSHFSAYLYRTLNYLQAPSRISTTRDRSRGEIPKKVFYSEILKNYVAYRLSDNKSDQNRFIAQLNTLAKNRVINAKDIIAVQEVIDSHFTLEVKHQLDKLSHSRQISSFTVCGDEIIVNFGTYKSTTRSTKSYAELELELAEANGDFVPERLRKTRG